jgi:hypothetical protein
MFLFQNYEVQSLMESYNYLFRSKEQPRIIHPVRHIYLRKGIFKIICFSYWFY